MTEALSLLGTIIPKSLQLNADQLLPGPVTIKVTKVEIVMGEQPVTISYEGDNNHPFKPGKSMRRVLVALWGFDANAYIGRSMTLYCDATVRYGGMEVGGIRISHMSDINGPVTMALTETKGKKKPFTVLPLVPAPVAPSEDKAAAWTDALIARMDAITTADGMHDLAIDQAVVKNRARLIKEREELAARITEADRAMFKRVNGPGNTTGGDGGDGAASSLHVQEVGE